MAFPQRPWLIWILGGGFFLAALSGARAERHFLVRAWQSEDGLPSNVVRSVVQAADGYLWVGTAEGVVRFDGARFSGFDGEPDGRLARLPTRLLMAVPSGDVWISTYGGGLLRGRGSHLTQVWPEAGPEVPSGQSRSVWQVVESKGGEVYLGRGTEVWSVEGSAPPRLIERNPRLDALFAADSQAALLRGRAPAGNQAYRLRDSRGRTWSFAAETGLVLTDAAGNAESVELRATERLKAINEMHEDREGNLWLSTPVQGLWRLRERRFEVRTVADGLSDRTATLVLEDRAGTLWVAPRSSGLDRIADGQVTHLEIGSANAQRPVSALCEARDGSLWAATREGSVFQQRDGVFRTVFDVARGVTKIFVIAEDGAARIWFGGRLGLSVWDGAELRVVDLGTKGSPESVTALVPDGETNMLVGTESGLVFRGNETGWAALGGSEAFAHQPISCLLPEGDGTIWVGTRGGGLFCWQNGRLTSFGSGQGVEATAVTCLLDDQAGYLWLGTLRGIFRVNKAELREVAQGRRPRVSSVVFDRSDGLLTRECSGGAQPAGWRSRDGALWFPTSNGLARVQPSQLNLDATPPPVLIEEVRAAGRILRKSDGPAEAGPGRSRLEFRYTALSFSAPDRVRFRIRLEGLEEEWRDVGNQRTTSFEGVPPGQYRFQVIASNGDGVWATSGPSVDVRVRPYYWQTLWFKITIITLTVWIAATVGAILSRARLRTRMLQLQVKSSRNAERTRIAQDLHDDLGASLTEISILASLGAEEPRPGAVRADPLPEIAAKTQALVGALDEIVWAVNPRHDTVGSLVEYLTAFAFEFLGAAGLALRLDVARDLPALSLEADRRHSVFLAVRETLNNVVKHAHASEVWLRLRMAGTGLEIVIEDNGRGFDLASPGHGEGVGNLHARLARLRGECRIAPRTGGGTTVSLIVPLS